MKDIPDKSVDLTVTSPPYDNLRSYNGNIEQWSFEKFQAIAKELYRVTKHGGVVVWVVGDETKNFCESLSSFKQALFFVEICGFNLLDTMIYKKKSYAPAYPTLRRYASVFEYMFVFSKSRPKTFNELRESKEETSIRGNVISSFRQRDGSLKRKNTDRSKKDKAKTNVWEYLTGSHAGEDKIAFKHPALFPEQLAEDHILSWSNPGDIVLDPMCGSGTTCKMAVLNDRKYIGFEISKEYFDIACQRLDDVEYSKQGE
jgi:DNA modification methylase